MFKPNNKNTKTTFWWFYCYLLTYFTPFSYISIVHFKQVNVSYEGYGLVKVEFQFEISKKYFCLLGLGQVSEGSLFGEKKILVLISN